MVLPKILVLTSTRGHAERLVEVTEPHEFESDTVRRLLTQLRILELLPVLLENDMADGATPRGAGLFAEGTGRF